MCARSDWSRPERDPSSTGTTGVHPHRRHGSFGDRPGPLLRILLVVVVLVGGACAPMRPEEFEGSEPRFVPEAFFAGRTRGHGFFQDRFGRIRREFRVEIAGRVEGDTLHLDEEFVYLDGERERRSWTILRLPGGRYEGRSADIEGVAVGRAIGRAANWRYTFLLPIGGQRWAFSVDDWMLLQDEHTLLNRSSFSKFGFEVGQAVILFQRLPDEARAVAPREEAITAPAA